MQPWIFRSFQPPLNRRDAKKKTRHASLYGKPRLLTVVTVGTASIILLLLYFSRKSIHRSFFCSATSAVPLTRADVELAAEFEKTASPLVAILHYATAGEVPQLSLGEIRRPIDVLQYLAPCNFLVFGLGHDSLMWDSFNPRGTTLFLEEDPEWTLFTVQRFPVLHAYTVYYPTRLSDADNLLASYTDDCWGGTANPDAQGLRGNQRCKLALSDLPDKVYDTDWDVIMIDAPRGYHAAQPGRMGVIYSAALMARGRKRPGVTHVFLHDVDRKVEKDYAKEFLCMKYKVGGIRKLWHFVIPPAVNVSDTSTGFC